MRIACPICKKVLDVPPDHPSRPFCSPRCKLADLGNWLDGAYRIPGPPTDQVEEDPASHESSERDRS